MKYNTLVELIEEAFESAKPAKFKSVEEALKVATSALKYLVDQCESNNDKKSS